MSNKRSAGTAASRGRATPTKPRGVPMPLFYAVLVLIAIGGAVFLLNNTQTLRDSALADANKRTIASSVPIDSLPSRGSANAPVTVIEFADFQCPACGTFATTLEPAIVKDYIDTGKVKFVYHDFPLTQHKNAVPAAEAARCANDQKAFWPMHDLLYANQAQWENSTQPGTIFAGYASQLKLDRGAYDQCVSSGTYRAALQTAYDASLKAGINQTPTFLIDGKVYFTNQLRGAIDAALAAKQ